MKPLINILIRTSNRPNYFKKCIQSIKVQSNHHYRIIVSVDDDKTEEYVKPYKLDYIRVKKQLPSEQQTAPYNLYLNQLMNQVVRGWIMILDDDDHLAHATVLETIALFITDADSLLVWKMIWPTGRVVPTPEFWQKLPPRSFIGMPCFLFHHSWAKEFQFDGLKAGDLRFFQKLYKAHLNSIWINQILIKTGNTGLKGKPIDLV